MKSIFFITSIFLSFLCLASEPPQSNAENYDDVVRNANVGGCPMPKKEVLVCALLLCNPIGLIIPESMDECLKVNRDWILYLAKLGPLESKPKCYTRDSDCNKRRVTSAPEFNGAFCRGGVSDVNFKMCGEQLMITNCDGKTGANKEVCERETIEDLKPTVRDICGKKPSSSCVSCSAKKRWKRCATAYNNGDTDLIPEKFIYLFD